MGSALLAAAAAQSDDGATAIGFLILLGFLYAMYKAMTKKKRYNVKLGGEINEV